MIKKKTGQLV